MDEQVLANTVEALYRTLTDESAWTDLLRNLSVAFDSPRVSIMRAPAALDEPYEMRAWNFDDETRRLYEQYYWSRDPIVPATRDDMALGV